MQTRTAVALAILILGAPALTGCIKGSDQGQDDNVTPQSGVGTVLPNETAAPDGRGQISAFNETNKTETTGIGSMVHTHDYWKGKERLDDVAWLTGTLIPLPVTPCKRDGNACTAGDSETYPPLTTIADFSLAPPPDMGMVYEGTKQVEIKLAEYALLGAGEPGNPAGHVFFDYLAANDEPGKFRKGGQLDLGKPVAIEIKPTDADMPHQTRSLWIFRVYSDSQMVAFSFNITISLVKGYDVVNWPPHPDLYADREDRTVFEGPVKLASKGSIDGAMFGADAGWTSPQKVISWGTERVEVAMTNVKFNGNGIPVPPKGFVMEYRNASTPFLMGNGVAYGGRMEDPSSTGTEYRFTIDLKQDRGDAMDTPYAQYSRWSFRLVPYWEGDGVTGTTCVDELFFPGILFGCQWYPWDIAYDLKVVAFGRSTASGVPASAQ